MADALQERGPPYAWRDKRIGESHRIAGQFMSDLFRKEALSRRSRALFGDVILRTPLSLALVLCLIAAVVALSAYILFGLSIDGQSVLAWISRDR